MSDKLQIYRIADGNVYTVSGQIVANLRDPGQHEPGWWALVQNECCATTTAAINETMGDFSGDFIAYGPYKDAEQARTLHSGDETEHLPTLAIHDRIDGLCDLYLDIEGEPDRRVVIAGYVRPERAKQIVRACNSHDALVEACEGARRYIECLSWCANANHGQPCNCGAAQAEDSLRAALATAKKGT